MSNYPDIQSLARAHGEPAVSGIIRAVPEDFQVIEIPAFEPSGEGEHRLLTIRKTNLNTADVANHIAELAKLPLSAISWAGLKDRQAVTEQWFGVHIANHPEPDWTKLNNEQMRVLEVQKHQRKLKRGVLKGNQFYIRVTQLEGDTDVLKARYEAILDHGVPNYFGEQRFGRHGGNIEKALTMFKNPKRRIKRHLRGIYLSAVRSYLFNAVLDRRVRDQSWNQLLPGEVCMLNDSHSIFLADDDASLQKRLEALDIHPTGPLWGEGESKCTAQCRELEDDILNQFPEFTRGLAKARMKPERRALRLAPKHFQIEIKPDSVLFSFELPPGAYATSVLRELVSYK